MAIHKVKYESTSPPFAHPKVSTVCPLIHPHFPLKTYVHICLSFIDKWEMLYSLLLYFLHVIIEFKHILVHVAISHCFKQLYSFLQNGKATVNFKYPF